LKSGWISWERHLGIGLEISGDQRVVIYDQIGSQFVGFEGIIRVNKGLATSGKRQRSIFWKIVRSTEQKPNQNLAGVLNEIIIKSIVIFASINFLDVSASL